MILIIGIIIVAVVYFICAVYVGSQKSDDGKRHLFSFLGDMMGGNYGGQAGCLVWIGFVVFIILIAFLVTKLFA